MQLMNSAGLCEEPSPAAGCSAPSPALPRLLGSISKANEFRAMPWFTRLVEILCNLRPLL